MALKKPKARVNGELTYAVVEVASGEPFQYLLIAKDLYARLSQVFGTELTVKAEIKGEDLDGCTYRHPLQDQLPTDKRGDTSPIIIGGDYITTESGTGLVHTAPGHGQDNLCAAFGRTPGVPGGQGQQDG